MAELCQRLQEAWLPAGPQMPFCSAMLTEIAALVEATPLAHKGKRLAE
jgi:hypothetical protein